MSKRKDSIADKLYLIQESIGQIELYTKDITCSDDFILSPAGMVSLDASVLRLQVIGESVKKLFDHEETNPLASHNEIPWKQIIGLRNIISHEYLSLDEVVIFHIIKGDLPRLKRSISSIITEFMETF